MLVTAAVVIQIILNANSGSNTPINMLLKINTNLNYHAVRDQITNPRLPQV